IILYHNEEQRAAAEASRDAFQPVLTRMGYGPITTEIVPATPFYFAEPYHQQYLSESKNPHGYCGVSGTGATCPIGVARTTGGRTREGTTMLSGGHRRDVAAVGTPRSPRRGGRAAPDAWPGRQAGRVAGLSAAAGLGRVRPCLLRSSPLLLAVSGVLLAIRVGLLAVALLPVARVRLLAVALLPVRVRVIGVRVLLVR